MSSAASRTILLALILAVTAGTVCADASPTVAPSAGVADEPEPVQESDGTSEETRRDVMRAVAWVSLCLILVLIIFVVSLMIASRRFRVSFMG